ncbi:MAG: hypothetical protein OET07_14860 [Desulfobacteraceae bacterium]|nr:hypothetical protein [Desulfobacteraceae bacterium]MDH3875421.1 hypothetical protein [Desulfobacteraceae bacterium]
MKKNGVENGEKIKPERDAKGRFLPGSPGGPGRSIRAKKPISFAKIEQSLQDDLKSTDPKVRHPATKILLALRKAGLSDDSEEVTLLDSRLKRVFGVALSSILEDSDIEVLDE